jgi:hypothetical protein
LITIICYVVFECGEYVNNKESADNTGYVPKEKLENASKRTGQMPPSVEKDTNYYG